MSRGNPFFTSKHLTIVCADRWRSKQFYREVLGAVALSVDDVCASYRLGSWVISLLPNANERSPAKFARHPMTVLGVKADDLEAAREFFDRCGVAVLETCGNAMIVIADPDGLPIEVTQRVVPPGRITMVRVPAPPWAPEHARGKVTFEEADAKHYGSILPAERGTLIERRADVLTLVGAQVEKYANDGCCPPGPGGDWFPKQVRLIGEFYIGREKYFKRLRAISCEVLVEARCLARGAAGPEDYLGLHIWLSYDPADGRLWARHVDSMVI